MQISPFREPISEHVWRTRYQWREGGQVQDATIEASWDRVALAVAGAEAHHHPQWRERFRAILTDFRFLPGGRILAGAGTSRRVTLFNGFVMGPMEDSVQGIFNALREAALTLQAGGGVGVDFSSLRPAVALAAASGGVASGPVSFMQVWEATSAVLASNNLRCGALLATLRCDHPDIEAFIAAKIGGTPWPHCRRSVLLSDAFMQAVEADGPWPLVFPLGAQPMPEGGEVCQRVWCEGLAPQPCLVHRRLPARALWEQLLAAQQTRAEPSVLFIDSVNRTNNLGYCERISTTHPGREVALPPYGACSLGAINLTRFVQHPFGEHPRLDFAGLKAVAAVATRFLDNVHELSLVPIKAQEKEARASRRIGLGITGLADMLAMLGLRYGSPASLELTHKIMGTLRDTAYRSSIEMAREKGPFPAFDKTQYGASPFVLGLSHELQDAIAQHGIRNSHLLAVAPSRATSLLANNVSSGIAPMLAFKTTSGVRAGHGEAVTFELDNAAWHQFKELHGQQARAPAYFVQAAEVSAEQQLRMMDSVQSCVDNALANVVYLPHDADLQQWGATLRRAWTLGLKGCALSRQCRP